eukprot:NODE_3877_length_1150_cov_66.761441_g3689_i0.p1 GENE.NODE_3877_length_1150_cov_66.761441_g3689_i0~~NODE_3877_length_1150_cov_66.761441_g3689_i0.p1  ORF type:complete len:297 (+),score=61.91 NODE_3877_length_1150_cov_66.761441_g3689_i0:55-891(+)
MFTEGGAPVITDEQVVGRLGWGTDEILVWLEREGLSKWGPSMVAHGVDARDLITASVEKIRDVWQIDPLQERRDLMDAIARLGDRVRHAIRREASNSKRKTEGEEESLAVPKGMMGKFEQEDEDHARLNRLKKTQVELEFVDQQYAQTTRLGQPFKRPQRTGMLHGNYVPRSDWPEALEATGATPMKSTPKKPAAADPPTTSPRAAAVNDPRVATAFHLTSPDKIPADIFQPHGTPKCYDITSPSKPEYLEMLVDQQKLHQQIYEKSKPYEQDMERFK